MIVILFHPIKREKQFDLLKLHTLRGEFGETDPAREKHNSMIVVTGKWAAILRTRIEDGGIAGQILTVIPLDHVPSMAQID